MTFGIAMGCVPWLTPIGHVRISKFLGPEVQRPWDSTYYKTKLGALFNHSRNQEKLCHTISHH
jgi:hypothetical protein